MSVCLSLLATSCGVGCSTPATALGLLALGVHAADPRVDLGLLVFVDPPRRYPFRQIVIVDAAGPAFLQEMRMVISAEQGQVANTALNVPSG